MGIPSEERVENEADIAEPCPISAKPDTRLLMTINLYRPETNRVIEVLTRSLKGNYVNVSVEWVDCPDLCSQFNLVAPGLCGSPAILELGSLAHLFPTIRSNKIYHFDSIIEQLNRTNRINFIIGAGKHSHPCSYDVGELYANLLYMPMSHVDGSMRTKNNSSVLWSEKETDTFLERDFLQVDPTCHIQGNFFLSEGSPGKVFQISAAHRFGRDDFLTSIQTVLKEIPENEEDRRCLLGFGGVFKASGNVLNHHIMPSSFETNGLFTQDQISSSLKYDKLCEPVTAVGTMMSDGGIGIYANNEENAECITDFLHITTKHFHSISSEGNGGHFYGDRYQLNYKDINYLGYFSFAEKLHCIDYPHFSLIRPTVEKFEFPAPP